jgi:hypothetical protein
MRRNSSVRRAVPSTAEEVPDLDLGHLAAGRIVGFVLNEHAP